MVDAKIYAAFRSGCLGDNILDAYFPFFANIICENEWEYVNDKQVSTEFEKKYSFAVPLTFVRQVLGVGMKNGSIVDDHAQYRVCKEELAAFKFDSREFDYY